MKTFCIWMVMVNLYVGLALFLIGGPFGLCLLIFGVPAVLWAVYPVWSFLRHPGPMDTYDIPEQSDVTV